MSIELNSNAANVKRQADAAANAAKDVAARDKVAKERVRAERQASADQQADKVQLSEDAQSLQRIQETLEREDSFDAKRVEDIKQAISEGRYPVDNDRLARRFLDLESQLSR